MASKLLEKLLGKVSTTAPSVELGPAARGSKDLDRVRLLPRRSRPTSTDFEKLQDKWTARLGTGKKDCICVSHYHRACCRRLLPIQAWALEEISLFGGLLGPIGVGDGKTLLDLLAALAIPNCGVAVLLLPPGLRAQLLDVDWNYYGQHFQLPNLGGDSATWLTPGRPMLHVVSFSGLSSKKSTALLEQINPDTIIVDEAHNLSDGSAARTKRFLRYFAKQPGCRLLSWSGTMTKRSILDYTHHANLALGDGSPTPHQWSTSQEWAEVIDPSDFRKPAGELQALALPGEDIRKAWNRRLMDTPGVVSSDDTQNCQASLIFHERPVVVPEPVKTAYVDVLRTWQRPDGEEIQDALTLARIAREVASGFFYRWAWPRGESTEVRRRWLSVRADWHREVREKLKRSREYLDSPLLLQEAAHRWHQGYKYRDESGELITVEPHSRKGPQATWDSGMYLEWMAVKPTALPVSEPVWIDDFLAKDAADWLRHNIGIAWYKSTCFGAALERLSHCPRFGAGPDASANIIHERGDRSIIASIKAHGTGKNLQCFSTCLVAQTPSDGAEWEQLVGRLHRQGQLADEVDFIVYRHLPAVVEALDRARDLAAYIDTTMNRQKLVRANFVFDTK